jgi:hypothetical protein
VKTEHLRAIEGKCAWPNLTLLPSGDIVATIWGQPCHGTWEGDLECWGSSDGGRTWSLRSQITQREPGTNRFNCATGLAQNGDLLTIVSGWSHRGAVGQPRPHHGEAHTLQSWILRSCDGGFTWRKTGELPLSGQRYQYVPFGDFQTAGDGALCIAAYLLDEAAGHHRTFFLRSYDDGLTWNDISEMNPVGNETALLHLGEGRWITASREESDLHLELMTSEDDGRSWQKAGALTGPRQVTGHLMRLRDGRVLLSYGNRIEGQCGVETKWSDDEGKSWSTPVRLADMPVWDGGYPSTVEREDGVLVTAFYADHPERGSNQYQMDVVLWTP